MSSGDHVRRAASGKALWVFHDLLEIRISGAQTGGAYCVLEDWPTPSYAPFLHAHLAEDEIVHVLEGRFAFAIDGEETEVSEGDLVRIPKGAPHAFRNLLDTPGHRIVTFVPAGPDRLWEEVGTPAVDRKTPPPPPIDARAFLAAAQRHGLEVFGHR